MKQPLGFKHRNKIQIIFLINYSWNWWVTIIIILRWFDFNISRFPFEIGFNFGYLFLNIHLYDYFINYEIQFLIIVYHFFSKDIDLDINSSFLNWSASRWTFYQNEDWFSTKCHQLFLKESWLVHRHIIK